MTTSAALRAIAVTALTGTTDAGANVFSPRDIASWDGSYPMLIVTTDDEDGEGLGRNGPPQFNVTCTLRVLGRVEHAAEDDDLGAVLVYAALEALRDQIKSAVINYGPLMSELQQFKSFQARMQSGGKEESAQHQGQIVVDIGLEFFQGPEDFYQPTTVALVEVAPIISEPVGTQETGAVITLPQ